MAKKNAEELRAERIKKVMKRVRGMPLSIFTADELPALISLMSFEKSAYNALPTHEEAATILEKRLRGK